MMTLNLRAVVAAVAAIALGTVPGLADSAPQGSVLFRGATAYQSLVPVVGGGLLYQPGPGQNPFWLAWSNAGAALGLGPLAFANTLTGFNASSMVVTVPGTTTPLLVSDAIARGLPITPQMFGAACNSNGTTGNGADDTGALQNALNAAQATGATLRIPGKPLAGGHPQMCRTTAPEIIAAHVTVDGDYCQPYNHLGYGTNSPQAGSWLFFDHMGDGIDVTNATPGIGISGVSFHGFCTYRPQPAYVTSGSWAPSTAMGWDISVDQDDSNFDHLVFLNPTKAIRVNGRSVIRDVRMNPYVTGISALFSADTLRISDVHVWPFAEINTAAEAYRRANLDALVMGRVDNPDVINYTAVGAKNCIHFVQTSDGVTSKFHGSNIDCDLFGSSGILVDNVTHFTGQLANYTGQAYDASSLASLNVSGANIFIDIANFRSTTTGQQAVSVNGAYNHVSIANPMVDGWGLYAPSGTQGAMFADTNDIITLSGEVVLINGPSAGVSFEGAGHVYEATLAQVH